MLLLIFSQLIFASFYGLFPAALRPLSAAGIQISKKQSAAASTQLPHLHHCFSSSQGGLLWPFMRCGLILMGANGQMPQLGLEEEWKGRFLQPAGKDVWLLDEMQCWKLGWDG